MGNSIHLSISDFIRHDITTLPRNATIGNSKTPICVFVVKMGYAQAFLSLIRRNANFDVVDHLGNSPMHYAAEKRTPYYLDVLVSTNFNMCILNNLGLTPLHIAVMHHKCDYVRPLRSAMFIGEDRPIHHAIELKDQEMIHTLITNTPGYTHEWMFGDSKYNHLNSCANKVGLTALSLAVKRKDLETIHTLLQHGADPDAKYGGKSPKDHLREISYVELPKQMDRMVPLWAALNRDTDMYRNIDERSDMYTGLLG
jgi:ankyrin repeat protein